MNEYKNTKLTFEVRADILISQMTLEEKISQMLNKSPEIERLGIPAYDWWNECLHGVARAGIATVFPQAIGLAASWNKKLFAEMGEVISDEARAKHHDAIKKGKHDIYFGLTFWTPNINIFRDPRWGRGQETYGEDPYLTAQLAVPFIRALQGNDPKYYKITATAKHFAVHSGPEHDRHKFNAVVSEKDLRETYLPAFEACVKDAKVESVMGAYNRTNGEACCASTTLIQKILREEWNFQGHFVSDCAAIRDIFMYHNLTGTPEEAAALAVNAGCDLNCGEVYDSLMLAVEKGFVDEKTIDKSLKRILLAKFKLGMFDPLEQVPYSKIPYSVVDCEKHRLLALKAARESIVLLKNEKSILPLDKKLKKIAVIGPNANETEVLIGNYHGEPSNTITIFEGIKNAASNETEVVFTEGSKISSTSKKEIEKAINITENADVIIAVLGIDQSIEGEEGEEAGSAEGVSRADRNILELLPPQKYLLRKLHATGIPVILTLINGSPISDVWADENIPAVLEAWYPGEEGGTAVADVIFGNYNPSGKLPVTFYKSIDQLSPFDDYSMDGRTYKFLRDKPLYPFGFGLSYTSFEYNDLILSSEKIKIGETINLSVNITNTGEIAGDEVVQLYIKDTKASVRVPIKSLCGFVKVHLFAGETKKVNFTIEPSQMTVILDNGTSVVEPGEFEVIVGVHASACYCKRINFEVQPMK
ncbi:glycoside hydrolase family 3 C-terminal domain-containing protein [bacterium]|nr:glycoside hydrolase family 3 C-terminal domain-containing protein [bacterium]